MNIHRMVKLTERMPEHMKNLPTWKGIPIPAATMIGVDGTPDFRVTDELKRMDLLTDELCGICGHDLDELKCYLAGPKSTKSLVFYDPPMHEECARFSFEICPYLAGHKDYASLDAVRCRHQGSTIQSHEMSTEPLSSVGLLRSRDYRLVRGNGTILVVAHGVVGEVEWLRGGGA